MHTRLSALQTQDIELREGVEVERKRGTHIERAHLAHEAERLRCQYISRPLLRM